MDRVSVREPRSCNLISQQRRLLASHHRGNERGLHGRLLTMNRRWLEIWPAAPETATLMVFFQLLVRLSGSCLTNRCDRMPSDLLEPRLTHWYNQTSSKPWSIMATERLLTLSML